MLVNIKVSSLEKEDGIAREAISILGPQGSGIKKEDGIEREAVLSWKKF